MRLNTKDKARLTEYFRKRCPYRMVYPDKDDYYCSLKYQNRCQNQHTWFVDYPDCPDTCPHHVRRLNINCDTDTKCKKLDDEIKDLKEFLEN